MFSMPPATATSTLPSKISCAAETMAWAPEPQTRFTVIAGTDTGSPAWTAAWRAGFILAPAWITFPMTTVPMSRGSRPARLTLAPIATAPRSGEDTSLRLPPNVPMAVRIGAARTTERDVLMAEPPGFARDLHDRAPNGGRAAFRSMRPIDNERIYTQISAYTCLSRFEDRNALRRPAEARGLQLPGAARSDAARHAILRSVVGLKRAAHHPILDLDQAAAGRADDDQRPGQEFGDGSDHAGPQYPAARARRIDRDRAGQRRPQEQGRAFDRGRRGAVARRARGLDGSAEEIRDILRRPARRTAAGSASRCHGDGARCCAPRRRLRRRSTRVCSGQASFLLRPARREGVLCCPR